MTICVLPFPQQDTRYDREHTVSAEHTVDWHSQGSLDVDWVEASIHLSQEVRARRVE